MRMTPSLPRGEAGQGSRPFDPRRYRRFPEIFPPRLGQTRRPELTGILFFGVREFGMIMTRRVPSPSHRINQLAQRGPDEAPGRPRRGGNARKFKRLIVIVWGWTRFMSVSTELSSVMRGLWRGTAGQKRITISLNYLIRRGDVPSGGERGSPSYFLRTQKIERIFGSNHFRLFLQQSDPDISILPAQKLKSYI